MPRVRASRVGSYLQRFGSTKIALSKPEFKYANVLSRSMRPRRSDESS